MNDYLVRGMSMDGFVKVVAIRSTEMVRRGAEIHKTAPNATAAFGRALTAASMMGNKISITVVPSETLRRFLPAMPVTSFHVLC